jgi:surface antigen
MNKVKSIIAAVVVSLSLSACMTDGVGVKQGVGALGGAAAGGLAGAQLGKGKGKLAFTALGVLGGAFLGSEIGSSLDKADRLAAEQAAEKALAAPVGKTISWSNPNTGVRGEATTVREGRDPAGAYCREYTTTIYVGGKPSEGVGRACHNPDGSWRVVS